jgi:hypothetical protein
MKMLNCLEYKENKKGIYMKDTIPRAGYLTETEYRAKLEAPENFTSCIRPRRITSGVGAPHLKSR